MTGNEVKTWSHKGAPSEIIDPDLIVGGKDRGEPDVVLVGALAQILSVTHQNKTAASNGSDGRVLMVAGAGFVQDPTIIRHV